MEVEQKPEPVLDFNLNKMGGSETKLRKEKGKMRKVRLAVMFSVVFVLLFCSASPLLAAFTHKVKAGDTLFFLSRKYGVPIASIKTANGLRSNLILIGQQLRIPTALSSSRSSTGYSYSREDIDWLARAVYSEARGEPYDGQIAVAAVILNRLQSGKFADNIKGIIFEPLAFSAVADGQIYLTPNTMAYQAVREAIAGRDPSGGALYYWNPAKSTSKWIWSRTVIKRIGNHLFAK